MPFGKGHDVIQQAQSGTGKTATFCAGILQSLDFNLVECQGLVLAPTRELAQQIEKVMRALGDYLQVSMHETCHRGPNLQRVCFRGPNRRPMCLSVNCASCALRILCPAFTIQLLSILLK